jgi:ATP-dependent 26S proteasome regulatory subunit
MKCPSNYWFLSDLQGFYSPNETLESDDGDFLNSKTGLYTFDGIDVWIYNQSKQGNMYLYFKSDNEKRELERIIQEKKSSKVAKITNPVYRWCPRSGWVITDKYSTKDAENDIFGYDTYINQIEKDITNHIKYNDFLKELGEVRSINYLLYGPPGTGKTLMARAVAHHSGCTFIRVSGGELV